MRSSVKRIWIDGGGHLTNTGSAGDVIMNNIEIRTLLRTLYFRKLLDF